VPSSSSEWGVNILTSPILAGQTREIGLDIGYFNIKGVDSVGNEYFAMQYQVAGNCNLAWGW
jgi:hypothetical protein